MGQCACLLTLVGGNLQQCNPPQVQPLHLRRIALLKVSSNKGEKASTLMTKLLEASKVADLENLSPEALILHLFLDNCPEGEDTKDVKSRVVEILRKKSSRGHQVEKEDVDDFVTYTKEQESCLLSRTGKTSKVMRTKSSRPCPICKTGKHPS